MKNKIIVSLAFVVPLVIYFMLCAIYPERTIESAVAKGSNLPQVIVFSTPMCGECRKMAPVIEQAKKNFDGKVEIVKVNASENKSNIQKLVREHQVFVVPTIVYIDEKGIVKQRTEGSMPYNEFEFYINKAFK
mgnify:FL=1